MNLLERLANGDIKLELGCGGRLPLTPSMATHCRLIWDILMIDYFRQNQYPRVIPLPLVRSREMEIIGQWAEYHFYKNEAEMQQTPILTWEANLLNLPICEFLLLMEASIHVKAKALTELIIRFGRSIVMGTTPEVSSGLKIKCTLPPHMKRKLIKHGVTLNGIMKVMDEMKNYELFESVSESESESDAE
ncbi:uncharacterized protein LOC111065081 isoform X2 [Drosophila obscura]|nr:uncharacterized protein LOC111065081 isoform X2 [Drosophila obscura]